MDATVRTALTDPRALPDPPVLTGEMVRQAMRGLRENKVRRGPREHLELLALWDRRVRKALLDSPDR